MKLKPTLILTVNSGKCYTESFFYANFPNKVVWQTFFGGIGVIHRVKEAVDWRRVVWRIIFIEDCWLKVERYIKIGGEPGDFMVSNRQPRIFNN